MKLSINSSPNEEEPNLLLFIFINDTYAMRILLFVIFSMILSACSNKVVEANYNTIPLPQSIKEKGEEQFILDEDTYIHCRSNDPTIANVAKFLQEYIQERTGYNLQMLAVEKAHTKYIVLALNEEVGHPEGYKINVNDERIKIEAATGAGLFYGVQTLRKSIPLPQTKGSVAFKAVEIEDYPRFAYRGMMLDVSRHFSSVEYVKRHIDILALHNINKFHMHLTEDQGWRIEIKKYPKLTEIGSIRKETIQGFVNAQFDGVSHCGYYTQDQLRDIVKYAADRYIEIVPEIDLPGHMTAALASYPELGCTGGPYEVATKWGIFQDVLCAGNEEVYEFLESVLTEVFEIFPSQYIHIGGDECPKARWKECAKCQTKIKQLALKDDKEYSKESKLQSYLTHRLENFIRSKGKKLIGWDEIIEGGLAPNATVMSWRGEEGGRFAAQSGHDVIMCPNSHLYLDYYQTENTFTEPEAFPEVNSIDEIYHFNPIPSGLNVDEEKRILGVQANLWVEQIATDSHREYMTLPRLAAVAELQWTNDVHKDYKNFIRRLPNLLTVYKYLGYSYSVAAFEPQAEFVEDKEQGTIAVQLSTPDNAEIYYTLDGTQPTKSSRLYTESISLVGKGKIQACAIRNNDLIDDNLYMQDFNVNKATLKPITQLSVASKYFTPPRGAALLVDGRKGNGCHVFGNPTDWIGFGGKMEVVIDLLKMDEVKSVTTSVLLVPNSKGVQYSIALSDDSESYEEVYSEKVSLDATGNLVGVLNKQTRYVKIEVIADNYAHVLSDEIIIE